MLVRVLGSAAGGGFPQWNCGCPNCVGVRRGSVRALARTQESVAVSADGDSWFLLNASPEIRQQIESFSKLHPRSQRDTPIQGIVLTNGDLDHSLGLLSLRESQPLALYSTARVHRGFSEGNVLYRTLQRFEGQVTVHTLELGAPEQPLRLLNGALSGLSLRAFAAPGKAALHLDQSNPQPEDNIGVVIRDERSGKRLVYIAAVGANSADVAAAASVADALFFDGTFWSSDELIALGASTRRAEDMAHWPISGPEGSLEFLRSLAAPRRILIHINNTNPILREDSAERALVDSTGVEVAFDGMELEV